MSIKQEKGGFEPHGYNPEYTTNDKKRKEILEARMQSEFAILGLDPSIVKAVTPRRIRDNNNVLHDVGHFIRLQNEYDYTAPGETEAECNIDALLMYQLNWRDGDKTIQEDGKPGRLWDFHAMVIPYFYHLNGIEVPLPPEITTYGYQVVGRGYHKVEVPHVRLDTMCMTSMPMGGHMSSEGHESLGCDCDTQRYLGQEIVHAAGGLTLLSPLEGRGNGLKGHGSQLMRQAMAKRYNEPMPDTYEAVQELGYPKDRRPDFYPLETTLMIMFGKPESGRIILHSNNPEKKRALEREGLLVEAECLFDKTRKAYYLGGNYQAKSETGGHARIDKFSSVFTEISSEEGVLIQPNGELNGYFNKHSNGQAVLHTNGHGAPITPHLPTNESQMTSTSSALDENIGTGYPSDDEYFSV